MVGVTPAEIAASAALSRAAEREDLTAVITFRVTPTERDLYDRAADHLRENRSEFIRQTVTDVARVILQRAEAVKQTGHARI